MLVTGPNLCEEDTARQSFTTALFLSSPGPHAILMVLNLEDEESEECDIVKRTQELLGAEVLQYCIVLLPQNDQQRRSREMINACGGRFHIIRDSEPKPAQRSVLVTQINNLVWLNGHKSYSVLTQELKTEETSQDVHEENLLFSVIYITLKGTIVFVRWILLILLIAFIIKIVETKAIFNCAAFVLSMVHLRHVLSPDVAIPLNLALITSIATTYIIDCRVIEELKSSRSSSSPNTNTIQHNKLNLLLPIFHLLTAIALPFILASALVLGAMISVWAWSDVLIACHAAPGVTIGVFVFLAYNETVRHDFSVYALGSFLCCIVGATLSMGVVTVLALLGVKITIILLILGSTMEYFYLENKTLDNLKFFIIIIVFMLLSCVCVLVGSVFII